MIRPVSKREYKGTRANIPSWLSNPDLVAPCICGSPMTPYQPTIIAEGELGLKRWFHASCWEMLVDSDDEWDDEEYED